MQPHSEYLSMFNHHLLKAFETGILQRLDRIWKVQPPIKIGLTEPEPLGFHNVMFPFSFLAVTIIIGVVMAVVEKVVDKIKMLKSNSEGSGVFFVKRRVGTEFGKRGNVRRGGIDMGKQEIDN